MIPNVTEEERREAAQKFDFQGWMKLVNTQMLELILLQGDAGKPKWYTAELTQEIHRRREVKEQQ